MSEIAVRKIIHVDMDAFYASVEQQDNPELRGKNWNWHDLLSVSLRYWSIACRVLSVISKRRVGLSSFAE